MAEALAGWKKNEHPTAVQAVRQHRFDMPVDGHLEEQEHYAGLALWWHHF